jgi:serpin B
MTSEEIYDNTKYLYSVSNNDYSILSNSLWYRDDIDLNSKVIKEIANVFYSEAYKVDFSKDLEKIYDYIKEKTNGLLDKCGDISPSTVLYVLNTLYFNDEWSFDFNVNGFKTVSFENADNSYVNKKLYYSNYNDYERMYETDDYSSYHIRSKNGYEFTYVKPNGDKKVKDIYNKEVIKDVVCHNYFTSDEEYNYHTRLAFPEYSAEYDKCINEVISDMGANEIFNYSLKPFSRISNEDISVGEIWHRTKLDITKEGFKASAATSIDITLASTTSGVTKINKYETFYVDKSFFYVREDNMGSILFSGVVNNVTND